MTPVITAVYADELGTAVHLVEKCNASLIETNTFNGQNVLHYLARLSDSVEFPFLLEQALVQCPDLINKQDIFGNTPLHIAMMEYSTFEPIQLLLGNVHKRQLNKSRCWS